MGDVEFTVRVPEALVRRAKDAGVQIENYLQTRSDEVVAMIEAQIRRNEALQRFNEIADQLQALPPELKPTLEEIDAEIRAYRAEQADSV